MAAEQSSGGRERLMSVAEVAEALRVGDSTVKRMIARHELRAARIGKLWRIPASEVDRLSTPVEISASTSSASNEGRKEEAVAVSGMANGTNGLGEGFRIFRKRPWESSDSVAASSAAARGRTPKTKKTALSGH